MYVDTVQSVVFIWLGTESRVCSPWRGILSQSKRQLHVYTAMQCLLTLANAGWRISLKTVSPYSVDIFRLLVCWPGLTYKS